MSRVPAEEADPKTYIDVDLNHFRDLIDYVFYYREGLGSASDGLASEGRWGRLHREEASGKVSVVRVACCEDQDKGVPEFSGLELPKRHPAFRIADDPPPIAEIIDFDVCVAFGYERLQPKASPEKTALPIILSLLADTERRAHFGFFALVSKKIDSAIAAEFPLSLSSY